MNFFDEFDLNGDGKLKKREYNLAYIKRGYKDEYKETRFILMEMFDRDDLDKDGEISREEFEREIAIEFEKENEKQ